MTPSEVMSLTINDYAFMLSGLEWWKTKEKEAIENARH
jgi:hypothetical protein